MINSTYKNKLHEVKEAHPWPIDKLSYTIQNLIKGQRDRISGNVGYPSGES